MEDSLSASDSVPARSLEGLAARFNRWRPMPLTLARAWSVTALALVVPYLPFLTLMHSVFIDEIHIAEYGRLFLDPHTSWSIFWQGDHGITPWYFIGGTLQELALRATSPSCIGSRLFGLAGSLIASGILVAWLHRRRTLPAAALLFGLLLLFAPLLMSGYTAGRIDGWMLSCAFAAGYQLAAFATDPRAWRLCSAGCLVSLGFFVWPSIAFLLPLLGLELLRATRANGRSLLQSLAISAAGAVCVFVLLGLVVVTRVPNVLSDIPKQLAVAGMTPTWTVAKLLGDIKVFLANLVLRSPWNVPFAILVWRSGAPRAALVAVTLPLAVMFATLLYGNRLLYAVPYLLIAFSGLFALPERTSEPWRAPGSKTWGLLVGSVAAAFVFAAVVRPVMPWLHRATRTETLLHAAAASVAPDGSTVCLDGSAIEFYLVGRSRHWRMFMATPDIVAQCDSVIVQPVRVPELAASMEAAGFHWQETLLSDQVSDAPAWELHVYGYVLYGPYEVYAKPSPRAAGASRSFDYKQSWLTATDL